MAYVARKATVGVSPLAMLSLCWLCRNRSVHRRSATYDRMCMAGAPAPLRAAQHGVVVLPRGVVCTESVGADSRQGDDFRGELVLGDDGGWGTPPARAAS